ncbi:hypothetical protein [Chitinophaga sp. XS-30]|uniref:hypothetical protein n=1 Tax=Chitinophaga sp. XS-30 TaxID=2604421 RepID=UPI0011DDE56A|nr:hypothetical protein [Chitinophaga sp. XS-30]QEH43629.1 hypothetical protein FW415_23340 [Chitinophaga sp. XS-30]
MEKISALIDKLQELKNSDAGLQTISYYTQLLQAEILHQRNLQRQQETKGHRHVAVILPAHTPAPAAGNAAAVSQDMATQNGYAQHKVPVKPRPQEQAATLFDPPQERQQETPVHKPDHLHTATSSHHDHNAGTAQQPPVPASRHDHDAGKAAQQPVTPPSHNTGRTEHPYVPQQQPPSTPSYNNTGNAMHPHAPHQPAPPADKDYNTGQSPSSPAEAPKTSQAQGNKPAADAPTGIRKELNELISKSAPSLNDALRNNGKVELADRLGRHGHKKSE